MTLGSTQTLTEMSTRSISWWTRWSVRNAVNLPPSCAVVRKSGYLIFLEPSGSLRACNVTALCFCVILIIHYNRHNYMFGPLMLANFFLYMILSRSYTACDGIFGSVWGKWLFCMGPRSVWVLGAWSRRVSLVIHFLILVMSRMGFIILH